MGIASFCTAGALAGIGALHASWGTGSSFPLSDRASLADAVAGLPEMPGPHECFAVAGLLVAAAGVVADVVPLATPARRVGLLGVAAALGGRGLAGIAGRTSTLVPWTPSERFVALDRRYYGPLCLALAAGTLLSFS